MSFVTLLRVDFQQILFVKGSEHEMQEIDFDQ